MKSNTKKIVFSSLIITLSILFSTLLFLIFDACFSSMYLDKKIPPPLTSNDKPYLQLDNGWYELKKSFAGWDEWGSKRYEVCTDQFGFRIDCNKQSRLPIEYVFLGDSFTYGINGSWEDTFVGIFSKKLSVGVINAGVSSYSPTPYLYQYKKILNDFSLIGNPNIIIGLDISDVQDEAGYWQDGASHPRKSEQELHLKKLAEEKQVEDSKERLPTREHASNEILAAIPIAFNKFRDRLLFTKKIRHYFSTPKSTYDDNESAAFNTNRSAFTYKDWAQLNQENAYPLNQGYAPLGVNGGLNRISSKLKTISHLAKKNNSKLYILIYPWPAQIQHDSTFNWPAHVKKLCEEIKCDGVIDTFPEFAILKQQNSNWYANYFISGDVHFNFQGNSIIAQRLIQYFSEINLISRVK